MPQGKTGTDAVAFFLKHICRVLTAYEVKLRAFIEYAKLHFIITEEQRLIAIAFLDTVGAACTVFQILAKRNTL